MCRYGLLGLSLYAMCHAPLLWAGEHIQHDLSLQIDPAKHWLQASDKIQIKGLQQKTLIVSLNADLTITQHDNNVLSIKPLKVAKAQRYRQYSLQFKQIPKQFRLSYAGKLTLSEATQPDTDLTGIDESNVLLSAGEFWYPIFYENELITYTLKLKLPKDWYAVSQGTRSSRKLEAGSIQETWQASHPQQEIYLLAAPFHEYQSQQNHLMAQVYLREDDPALAKKYLDATFQYVAMYNQLLGDYPYRKFATVENTWNSGWGMPSFTLLGSRILRYPFIIYSSFPHEILHNWWGNSVYVDYQKGNWSEGLTSYLADHLMAEQRGQAREYRLNVLQQYHDFVGDVGDFALTDFRSKEDNRTNAIGYSKTSMVFHMLRLKLGDEQFKHALQYLYQQQKFKITSYMDLQKRIMEKSKTDLNSFFSQWVERVGAPELVVENIDTRKTADRYLLTLTLKQQQSGAPYQLAVPVWLWFDGQSAPKREILEMHQKEQSFRFSYSKAPLRVDVDPLFDVFRKLDSREIPAAISQGFGAQKVYLLLPKKAPAPLYQAYKAMAQQWMKRLDNSEMLDDSSVPQLPENGHVWILGWENAFRGKITQAITGLRVNTWDNKANLGGNEYRRGKQALLVAGRRPDHLDYSMLWLGAAEPKGIARLATLLPHYASYSYLVFQEDGIKNTVKGKWQLNHTPMKFYFGGEKSSYAAIPERKPLASVQLN